MRSQLQELFDLLNDISETIPGNIHLKMSDLLKEIVDNNTRRGLFRYNTAEDMEFNSNDGVVPDFFATDSDNNIQRVPGTR